MRTELDAIIEQLSISDENDCKTLLENVVTSLVDHVDKYPSRFSNNLMIAAAVIDHLVKSQTRNKGDT